MRTHEEALKVESQVKVCCFSVQFVIEEIIKLGFVVSSYVDDRRDVTFVISSSLIYVNL